ncbi:MAG: fibronectin type III domain-containing protein [Candidatus Eisenbacteria bacterium]|nr:fibronectin type III domain-containing protein [Candidatus Eisenbacteria bacterium]
MRMIRNGLFGSWAARIGLLAGCATLALFGCSEDHSLDSVKNPADPSVSGIEPPTPSRLSADVSSRTVTLDWDLSDDTHANEVDRYRIYRLEPTDIAFQRVDSTDAPPIALSGLDNGTIYRFRVSAVLKNGLEGNLSSSISATPGIFGIVLAGGDNSTNTRDITITAQSTGGTVGVKLGTSSDLTSASTRPFSTVLSWTLDAVDGEQTVYAQFIDAQGNSSPVVSDSIVLDRRAEILSVSASPLDVAPGETVQFRLDADEPFGEASVVLGSNERTITLRDDGTSGDQTANDGVYSRDYVAEEDLQIFEALVTGQFTDQAGNRASPRVASGRLTVSQDPTPVVLGAPQSSTPTEITLSWSQTPDAIRFSNYRVYRGTSANVYTNPARRLLTEIFSIAQTTYTDTDLDPSQTYYYVVEVRDDFGNGVPSNEVSGRTLTNTPPDAVVLDTPTEVSEDAIVLNFSRSFAEDFAEYRVFRSLQADVVNDSERRLLTRITNAATTSYTDRTELEQNRTYYYVVVVADEFGATAASNVINATTPDRLPTPVDLSEPSSVGETSVLLSWTTNDELDFERYEVRRSGTAGVSETSSLIASISDSDVSSYLDTGLTENTEYFYRVFVVDRGGNRNGSGEIQILTGNADPSAVVLAAPSEQQGAQTPSVVLSWGRSSAHDFERYRIFRDTSPGVSTASTAVRSILDPSVTSFTDRDLDDNTKYYYRVFVEDDAGGATGSNEQSITTDNRPPTAVELVVAGTTPTSITLSWTENANADFDEYRLYRGTTDSNISTLVSTFSQREQTGHTVFVTLGDETVYFFKVVVYDRDIVTGERLSTDSNVVSGQASAN